MTTISCSANPSWSFLSSSLGITTVTLWYFANICLTSLKYLTHCVKRVQIRSVLHIFLYSSARIQENTDQKKLRVWSFFTQWLCSRTSLESYPLEKKLFKVHKKDSTKWNDSKNDTEKTLKFCRYNNIDFIKKHYVALYLNMIYTYICTILIILIYVHTDDL